MESTVPPRVRPTAECDVVMKGGITSGVIYPRALSLLASHYRIRGIGGASAGAIGAAMGAAAEYGRAQGGFETLHGLPDELVDGKLARLFQPQRKTRPLFGLMLVATGSDRPGPPLRGLAKARHWIASLVRAFPVAGLIGLTPGLLLIAFGAIQLGAAGVLLILAGGVVAIVGWIAALALRLVRLFTVHVPANRFGICSGLSTKAGEPGFTDWLSQKIDEMAGLPAGDAPLTFGQLWAGGDPAARVLPREIDLRLITTCLTEGRPFEMPFEARRFFFDPVEWRQLFPGYVVDALERAPAATGDAQEVDRAEDGLDPAADDGSMPDRPSAGSSPWAWEDEQANGRRLLRLPDAEHLPVIVATRMSLSFPLLISALPLYTINRQDVRNQEAAKRFRTRAEQGTLVFSRVWFTDGGFCSNFPVYLFDAALSSRPTFAINLGSFPTGREPDPDQTKNIEWARNNRSGLLPTHVDIAEGGLKAVTGFASAAFNSARNWQDSTYLDHPGYRDRIVRVMQSKREGGMNLRMDTATINGLADRGETAARVMVDQFTNTHYANDSTGWDNHRWVRYRALLSVLPDWAASYKRGFAVLGINPAQPPSYEMSAAERALAAAMTQSLTKLADDIEAAGASDPGAVAGLTDTPRPRGRLRRIPQI